MTIEELYGKVLADDALKTQLGEAAKAGKLVEWVAEQGVETTEAEILAFVNAAAEGGSELSDEELDKVAGGGYFSVMKSIGKVIDMDISCSECF